MDSSSVEEDEEEESVLLFLFLCLSAGRLDLMGDKTTLWGEGTSLVKVEGGMVLLIHDVVDAANTFHMMMVFITMKTSLTKGRSL